MNKNYLKWKCRRGVLELDTVLENFWLKNIDGLSDQELTILDSLLNEEDPLLLDWLVYNADVPDHYALLVKKIRGEL